MQSEEQEAKFAEKKVTAPGEFIPPYLDQTMLALQNQIDEQDFIEQQIYEDM